MKISLLPNLTLNQDGHLVNENDELVHLRQGDMDGACGPYCVVMSLLVKGVVTRSEFTPPLTVDYRTRSGRVLKAIHSTDPLVLGGMTDEQLQELFQAHNTAFTTAANGQSKNMLAQAKAAIESGSPVIMDVESRKEDGLSHWTLGIGSCENCIYLLDPGYELPIGNYWNAMLTVNPSSNRFGYRYISPFRCIDVEVSSILIVD